MARNSFSGYDSDDYKDTDKFWSSLMQDLESNPESYYEYFDWLERLRKSGIVNMYGASPYLEEAFEIPEHLADIITMYWMKHYNELLKVRGWRR